MMIIDETRAILGSMALSTLSLDFRREVVGRDSMSRRWSSGSTWRFTNMSARTGAAASLLPGDRIA